MNEAKPFPPIIKKYLDYLNQNKEIKYNMCLVNWYFEKEN